MIKLSLYPAVLETLTILWHDNNMKTLTEVGDQWEHTLINAEVEAQKLSVDDLDTLASGEHYDQLDIMVKHNPTALGYILCYAFEEKL